MSSRPIDRRLKSAGIVLALLAFSGVALAVDSLSLRLDRFSLQGWEFVGSELLIDWSGGPRPLIELRTGRVEHAQSSTILNDLHATCLKGSISGSGIRCTEGRLGFRHEGLGRVASDLTFRIRDRFSEIELTADGLNLGPGRARLTAGLRGGDWSLTLQGEALDPDFLHRALAPAAMRMAGLSLSGRVEPDVTIAGNGGAMRRIDWRLSASGLGFETTGGEYAADGLAGVWTGGLRLGGDRVWRGEQTLTLESGALLTPHFFLEPRNGTVSLSVGVESDEAVTRVRLAPFSFRHPNTLELSGESVMVIDRGVELEYLKLRSPEIPVGAFYDAYIRPVLGAPIFEALNPDGGLVLENLLYSGGRLTIDAGFREGSVSLADQTGSVERDLFAFSSIDGDLHWSNGDSTPPTTLRVGEGSLFGGILVGESAFELKMDAGGVELLAPATIPLFDGGLEVDAFGLALGEQGPSVNFDGYLTPVSLKRLSTALGMPPFSGQLSGMIPGLLYREGTLRVDGSILVRVFDGSVLVNNLELGGLLGSYPVMDADLRLQSLDLERMTDAFSFGKITGRLEGRVDNLRLEEWRPVRFDAWLATPPSDETPHRISQRAVDNISNLGGVGVSGALSRSFLRFFDEFGYDRLGVSCRLERGVCEMGGVEQADQGYYLVKGGGLPRIDIKGFNKRTDWEILTGKLRQIAEGGAPRIE